MSLLGATSPHVGRHLSPPSWSTGFSGLKIDQTSGTDKSFIFIKILGGSVDKLCKL